MSEFIIVSVHDRNRQNIWTDIFGPRASIWKFSWKILIMLHVPKKYIYISLKVSVTQKFYLEFRKRTAFHQTKNHRGTLLGTQFFIMAAGPVPGLMTHFTVKTWWKNSQREIKSCISWMTALTARLFKRRQATSGTSNATGMCKWKYIQHPWTTYILNLMQATLPALLCTTGGEELLYSLVAGKDLQYHQHHKLIAQPIH